jgi:Predicted Zn-dependent hydrolases of the beta-lactamase fold
MQIQWLGHSAFKVTATGAQVLFDPFLNGNPSFSGNYEEVIAGTTHVLLTHAHNDHWGDTVDVLRKTGALLISSPEICDYIEMNHEGLRVHAMNMGGTRRFDDIAVSVVRAVHSSSYNTADGRIIYGGTPMGLILEAEGKSVYHMGDTDIFGDMALVEEIHQPQIGLVPIGDNFTMGPEIAALAVNRYFNFETVIPCHYGTFGLLEQSADRFAELVRKGRVEALAPMGSIEV